MITKKCKQCGKLFSHPIKQGQGKRLHCSDLCRKKYCYRFKYHMVCVICRKEFKTKSFTKQTCSNKCFNKLMSSKVSSRYDQECVAINKTKRRKRASDNERKNLSNKYVKHILYLETGIKPKEIKDLNIIELKRQQLRLYREIQKSKGGMKDVTDRG